MLRSVKMKIKLALLEADKNYLIRLVGVFSTEYADRLEVHSSGS